MYKYIYGPVPSRRLGISLGIDILPRKICNFNCLYCECGKSFRLVNTRAEYCPSDSIIEEIRDYLKNNPRPDYITFSGSGEPTLHSGLGFILRTLKEEYSNVKIAIITNGSLMKEKKVREELMNADVVLPSLDSADEKTYIKIDRPHPAIKLKQVIDGMAEFSRELKEGGMNKKLWLEVFIIDDINTDDYNITKFREAFLLIKPDRIQLNTLDRPGAEEWVKKASFDVLERVKEKLNLENVEIIKKYEKRADLKAYRSDIESAIVDTLKRRPSTAEDLSEVLKLNREELLKYLEILSFDRIIKIRIMGVKEERGIFYMLNND
jgi:wyosine [tRNA(Phe)-imidazoG37] synthetase (radical SAM superfamily)